MTGQFFRRRDCAPTQTSLAFVWRLVSYRLAAQPAARLQFLVQQMITKSSHVSPQLFARRATLCTATFVAFQPTTIGVDYMAALLGNLLGTVDGLLGGVTGSLSGVTGSLTGDASAGGSASASASGTADLSHTLDLGAAIATNPSVDLSTSGLLGTSGIGASVSAPTMVGASADVGHLDLGGLLHGLV
jgi:hypothetical protein